MIGIYEDKEGVFQILSIRKRTSYGERTVSICMYLYKVTLHCKTDEDVEKCYKDLYRILKCKHNIDERDMKQIKEKWGIK